MLSFPNAGLIENQQENPCETAPLNQVHPIEQWLRLEKVDNQAPSEITSQKDSEARALRG